MCYGQPVGQVKVLQPDVLAGVNLYVRIHKFPHRRTSWSRVVVEPGTVCKASALLYRLSHSNVNNTYYSFTIG